MANFEWNFTPGTLILAGNLVAMVFGGRVWFKRQIDASMKIENTQKLQNIAAESVIRLDARNIVLEEKIERNRDSRDELDAELTVVREYLLRDAVWHIQVLAQIESLGGTVSMAPTLPPRQREYKEDDATT